MLYSFCRVLAACAAFTLLCGCMLLCLLRSFHYCALPVRRSALPAVVSQILRCISHDKQPPTPLKWQDARVQLLDAVYKPVSSRVFCLLTLFLLDMDTCESPPTYTLRTRVKAHLCETRPLVCSSRNCLCPSLLGKPQDGVASNSTSEGCLQVSIWKEPNPCVLRLP